MVDNSVGVNGCIIVEDRVKGRDDRASKALRLPLLQAEVGLAGMREIDKISGNEIFYFIL